MDLSRLLGEALARAAVASRLDLVLAELVVVDPDRGSAIVQGRATGRDTTELETLLVETEAALTQARAKRAAALRRAAVLESLAGLGYEGD